MKPIIETLTLANLKGQSRAITFQPLTVVTGRNHAGKSAVLQAVTLAALGYVPALGKTNAASFRLASGKAMSVTATTGDGRTIERSWTAKGNSVTAKKSDGADDLLPSPLAILNPLDFIAANPKQRLAMLAHLAGSDALEILAEKNREWHTKLGSKPVPMAMETIDFAGYHRDLAAAMMKQAKDTVASKTATMQELSAKEESVEPVTPAQRKAAAAAVEKATKEHSAAVARAGELEERERQASDARDELETFGGTEHDSGRHERLIAERDELRAAAGERDASRLKIMEELAAKRGEESPLVALTKDRTAEGVESEITAAENSKATRTEFDAAQQALRDNDTNHASLIRRIGGLAKTVADATAKLDELDKLEACPVCRACEDGWRDSARNYYERIAADAEGELKDGEQEKKEREAAKVKIMEDIAVMQKELRAIEALELNRRTLEAFIKLPRVRARVAELERQGQALADEATKLRNQAHDLAPAIRECERTATAVARVVELQAIVAKCPQSEDLAAAVEAVASTEATMENAKQAQEDLTERAITAERIGALTQQIAECRAIIETQTAEQTRLAALKDEISTALDNAVRDSYKPIVERANAFGAGVIGKSVAVHEDELGYFGPTGFVPFEAMSGTEQTVVTAAIQAALSASTGGILMLDELSRLDAQNKFRLAKNIEAAITAGELRQAIIVDHDAPAWREFYTVAIDDGK